jgi:hypothetical protein
MAKRRPFTMSIVVSEYRGDWSSNERYYAGDIIRHNGAIYLALKASTNLPPPDAETWKHLIPAGVGVTVTPMFQTGTSLTFNLTKASTVLYIIETSFGGSNALATHNLTLDNQTVAQTQTRQASTNDRLPITLAHTATLAAGQHTYQFIPASGSLFFSSQLLLIFTP